MKKNSIIRLSISALIILLSISVQAQKQKLSLKECIQYADSSSIQIKRAELNLENNAIQVQTAKANFLPSLNANVGQTWSFGRSTGFDNVKVSNNISNTTLNVNGSMPLFTGFRNLHKLRAEQLNYKAAQQTVLKTQEELALQVMAAYLDVLYNKELVTINEQQVHLSAELLQRKETLLKAGKTAASEYYEQLAQASNDSVKLTQANNNLELALLTLGQLINYPDIDHFDIADYDTQKIMQQQNNTLLASGEVLDEMVLQRPAVKAALYSIDYAKRNVKAAKSGYFPELTLSAGYGNSYFYNYSRDPNMSFKEQLDLNGGQNIGLRLSIPIFNRFQVRNNVKQAKLNVINQQLNYKDNTLKLKKEIQTAYYNAEAARKQYQASSRAVHSTKTAFEFAQEKFNNGRMSAFDYSQAKVRFENASAQAIQAKYQYVFKTKIFLFYQTGLID